MTLVRRAVRPIWRFARRTRVERGLLVRSFLLLLAITVGLRLMPLVSLQRALSRLARKAVWARRGDELAPDTIVWAVTAVSCYVPRATCLLQALALQTLLEVHSCPSRLCIGIGRGADGGIGGHAWVEAEGAGEIPEEGRAGYRRVLTLASCDNPVSAANGG